MFQNQLNLSLDGRKPLNCELVKSVTRQKAFPRAEDSSYATIVILFFSTCSGSQEEEIERFWVWVDQIKGLEKHELEEHAAREA